MTKTKKETKMVAAGARYWIYNPNAKKTIVAVHGLRGTHHGLQFIANSLPQYRFIIPDLPGFGESKPLRGQHTVKNYEKWLVKFISELKLATKPVLLGHSFGSIVASGFASENPNKITKLILINPLSLKGSRFGSFVGKSYYKLSRFLPEKTGTKLLKSNVATTIMTEAMLSTRDKQLRSRVYEQHFAYFGTFANRRSVNEAFASTMSGSVLPFAAKLTMPVLLIVGARDSLAPLKGQARLYNKLPNGELYIIPSVGHLIHYETPEKAAEMIEKFVN
ncbi:MAG: alpha/beta hydrolase [Candidatus Saccharibacteria bacterium]|nr:alpha/beta hydrolase [Candidatus Saccharibacteria bacterium]